MTTINQKVANLWVARIIPLILVGIVGYATWVIIFLVCVDYLLKPAATVGQPRHGAAIAIVTIYACLLLLLALAYLRLVYTIVTTPGYTPRGPQWYINNNNKRRRRSRSSRKNPRRHDLEKQNGVVGESRDTSGPLPSSPYANVPSAYGPANDIITPDLQDFYKRDVFTCESDGRPIWCSTCLNWKPDRAHHCRERTGPQAVNIHWIVVLALAALFSLFLLGMSGSSLQFVFLNTTTIENLSRKTKVWQLAVHIPDIPPRSAPPHLRTITFSPPVPNAPGPASTALPPELRTFAILHSRPGENPWDLGPYRNFKSVMGDHWYDWLLPIKHSPCARHDWLESEFEMGPVVERMKREAGIVGPDQMETDEKPRRHRRRRRRRSAHASSGDPETGDEEASGGKSKRHHKRHRRRSESGRDAGVDR
ncbi:MAG: hypothetical protein Q9210_003594 [Variospora velana]